MSRRNDASVVAVPRPDASMTLEELGAELRHRSATLRAVAQGPSFYVHIAVPPIIDPVRVENPDLEIAVRAALQIIDDRLEARSQAAEVAGS